MSNMKIIEIPAYLRDGAGQKGTARKLRVAAYCRVSTEEEEQQGSFEIQKLYYTEKINSTPEWEVAGIYADDGISGVHTKKRDGFNQMIQDCKKRKIDLILTKSISRFARNTLDSIQYVRTLKQMGIAVVFEKENINTATMNSEMILTVLSAFAQAESESISQNVARGKRMGYKHGKFAFPYGRIIGYRKGADGKPEIIPEQAEVIAIRLCLYCMKTQIFNDGNKRTAVIFANHYMISKGKGLIVIPEKDVPEFKKLLVAYYENRDNGEIHTFMRQQCWRTF